MRVSRFQKKVAVAVLAVGALLLVAGELIARRTPSGAWRSYRFMPHDRSDVIHFTNGTVRWFTCGVSEEGTYHRSADGGWIWDYYRTPGGALLWGSPKRVPPRTNTFVLRPHLFWLTVVDAARPTNIYRLPRALRLPKEEHSEELRE
jgi:hypothetical protein